MSYGLVLIPLSSAFIGWFTVRMGIKLVFHPRKAIRFAGFTFQGMLPRYQSQAALQIGKLVNTCLFSFADISKQITHPDQVQKIMPLVEAHIDQFLRQKLVSEMPMISMFIGEKTITQLKGVFIAEIQQLFPQMIEQYLGNLERDLDLGKMLSDKLTAISADQLEQAFYKSIGGTLRKAEILAGLFGLTVGLLQLLLFN
jgi:uncharacterized membrane protein YheB (UPF0754 family)